MYMCVLFIKWLMWHTHTQTIKKIIIQYHTLFCVCVYVLCVHTKIWCDDGNGRKKKLFFRIVNQHNTQHNKHETSNKKNIINSFCKHNEFFFSFKFYPSLSSTNKRTNKHIFRILARYFILFFFVSILFDAYHFGNSKRGGLFIHSFKKKFMMMIKWHGM